MKVLTPSDMRCPQTGQTAFVSRSRAEKVRDRVYKCPHCGWWHLAKARKKKDGATQNQTAHSGHDALVRA